MAHGLELRVPILDHRLVELLARVPDQIRMPGRRPEKALLRQAFPALLTPTLLAQSKKGFSLPIGRWMLGPLRMRCENAMAELKHSGLLRPEGVDDIWRAFLAAPESPMWSRAWALVVLGSYLQKISKMAVLP
jgi:asparagine synthase (glutamine-hydrolysing)